MPEPHSITGVGTTALVVAAARAIASRRAHPLIDDPFAEVFVHAAGHDELPRRIDDIDEAARPFWEGVSTYLALRTRAFDDFVLAAAATCPQVVIVASGLDSRGFRLGWPAGVKLFEIDRAPVLDFKSRVLHDAGAQERVERVAIPTDVAHDWVTLLADAGFDGGLPTAWLVEGLMPYLSADLETALIGGIDSVSAPGSRIAIEFIGHPGDSLPEGVGARTAALFDTDPRPDTLEQLRHAGWEVRIESPFESAAVHGVRLPNSAEGDPYRLISWTFGIKNDPGSTIG